MKWIFKVRLFSLDIGGYRFSPGLFMTILTFSLAYIMLSLGQWQLSRAQYKDNLQQKIAERQIKPAISYSELPYEKEERVYLPVRLEGVYDTEHSFFLDNRIVDSIVGYEVFTPFKMTNGLTVLVNRGFLPQGRSRQELPVIVTPGDSAVIEGLLEKIPSKGLVLADDLHKDHGWPAVLQYIEIAELEGMLDTRLMAMIVRLSEGGSGGLKFHQPVLNLNSAKNNGYAFQWFAMMSAVLALFFVVNTKKRIQ